jgi:UDP-3-O-[3-hydroxymyristoyl] glucosamine N-acyltransferase
MRKTVGEIAEFIGAAVDGDANVVIQGVNGIREAVSGELTFLANPKYQSLVSSTQASAIIVALDFPSGAKPLLRVEKPSQAFTKAVTLFMPREVVHPQGIHPSAVVAPSVKIGARVGIGACAVIEDEAEIGDDSVIYAGCYVGRAVKVGQRCVFYANVSVRERVVIGNRVLIQSGSVIGSEGFGYVTVDGVHHLIPQVGTVVIEDDVDIGANVTIDRARFDKTVIGRGTKIDNLVQIAHNVIVGPNCLIVSQAGISGSTRLGEGVTIAGQAGIVGHVTIADGAVVAAQSGVSKSIPERSVVWGYPAKPLDEAKRVNACVQRLPKMMDVIADLKRRVERLESADKPSEES